MIIRSSLTNKWGLWTILMGLVVVGTGTYSQFNVCFQMSDQWSSKLIYYNVLIAYHCFEFPSFIRLYFPQSLQYNVKNISALWEFVEYMFQYVWNCIEIDIPLVINVVHINDVTLFSNRVLSLCLGVSFGYF